MARYSSPRRFASSRAAHRSRRESGQVLILSALVLPLLMGMAALAVDLGGYADHRRTLQNAADSIALAAARDLPDASAATASAHAWADNNNIPWSDVKVTITPVSASNPNPKVSVDISRPHTFVFIRALGVPSRAVGAHAAAIKTSPGGVGWPHALVGARICAEERKVW